ncbi:3-isopropylmalate dehydratase, small subunit [Variovorax paradoxus B4]|uniref:3-isopropylmalate dehydratase n=1 Tax=Variovorax paradoxus B4 TaxID=1246301 RepID=T1XLP1_VARPD|nr:3-isopropylmalate dehydratase small subunit [Variovorax paradoxus]AGU53518.1 3-isopropylmalate dehydratase, small subunit [Variovorax paradoxus B4]
MTPFTVLQAVAAPLLLDNIDTDTIIRVEPLFSGVPREQLGPHALAALRFRADGSEDPDFVLNRTPYRSAHILLAGDNFGCGSSREGAVWALMALGIRCVVAPSFGDIFYGNCFQNGLLPVQLARAQVEALAHAVSRTPSSPVTVDLPACTVHAPGMAALHFALPARRREGLLRGLDDLELTLARSAEIDAFQARDAQARPWIYLKTKETP